jgi:uncharacterized membrane protein
LVDDLVSHAFVWKDGVMQDIGTQRPGSSYATGLNDKGHVAGYFFNENGQDGFLYDGTTMRTLPRLQTKAFTPNALNAKDEVVGSDGARAALYTKGKLYVLKNLLDASGTGWKALDTAASIRRQHQRQRADRRLRHLPGRQARLHRHAGRALTGCAPGPASKRGTCSSLTRQVGRFPSPWLPSKKPLWA